MFYPFFKEESSNLNWKVTLRLSFWWVKFLSNSKDNNSFSLMQEKQIKCKYKYC